jgi:GTP cyclohydrolase II
MTMGDLSPAGTLTRVHSECLTGDVLCSSRCDCGEQLVRAQARIGREGRGVLIYLRGHEGRGIGLVAKLNAYALQDAGADTVDANLMLGLPVDARCFDAAAQILDDLDVRSIRLLTNNPSKVVALERLGVRIDERVAHEVPPTEESSAYLIAKRTRMGHMLGTHVARGHP